MTTYILLRGELVLMPSGEIHFVLEGRHYTIDMADYYNTAEEVNAGLEALRQTAKKESEK